MQIVKASFLVVTPMFLGESSQGESISCAERIRGASVKGALRFYFRALNWSRICQTSSSDEEALKKLHAEESDIFGSAVRDGKGGQASFLLRIKSDKYKPSEENLPYQKGEIGYLLGMGLFNFRNGLLRKYIPEGVSFDLELILKPSLSTIQTEQIKDCLLAFGLMGGLGSRARKGFGSVAITSLQVNEKAIPLPQSVDEYKTMIKNLLGNNLVESEPPYSAFSKSTRLQLSGSDNSSMELLKKHGHEMGLYRGYGRNNKVFNKDAEKNFQGDHDWAYDLSKNKVDKSFLPKRAVFGLPHPYYLSGASFKVDVDSETGRRASPLMAHVHQFPDGKKVLLHTLMRSQFLPDPAAIKISTKHKASSYDMSDVNNKVDWQVLIDFLERFNPKNEDIIHG